MTTSLFLKTCAIWLVLVVLAIGNGAVRDGVLVQVIGSGIALPVSGISLSIIIFMVAYVCIRFFGKNNALAYFLIGLQWVLMTLMFEFLFGHYVAGKSWSDIWQVFNVMKGNLFIIVLAVSLFSPLLVAKIKKLL